MKQHRLIIQHVLKKQVPGILVATVTLLVGLFSCTDLTPKVYDQATSYWHNQQQIDAGIGLAYRGLRDYTDPFGFYSLNEAVTDEIIVPTRGRDWYDNGVWEQLWKHSWSPENANIVAAWRFIYGNGNHSGIAPINSILHDLKSIKPAPSNYKNLVAQLKTVRAFYNYLAMDLFGDVPIADSINAPPSARQPRASVFAYIEKELKTALPDLRAEVNIQTYGTATQWLAYSVLAKLYLNAEVFTGKARWPDCIAACDAVINSNLFSLEPDFFANFRIQNEGSKESIFSIPYDGQNGLTGFYLQQATLNAYSGYTYFGFPIPCYNGFCSTSDFYNQFAPNDLRRNMFLVGQQYTFGIPDQDHIIPGLVYDPLIKQFSNPGTSGIYLGARCVKWEVDYGFSGYMNNDFAVYRLADIILMKAEAQYRYGDVSGAIATINQKINGVSIRSRAGLPDFAAAEMNAEGLLAERARELSWEGHRRNDMIRLGHFTDSRTPEKNTSEDFRKRYPIPSIEIFKNPGLSQNEGY